ncbi:unnamed protein product, partial [Closterium sp. NIES-54]
HYTYDDCHIDLRPLAQLTNARLLHCCASGLDLDQRAVVLADGRPPIRYDVLSIDIGITPLGLLHCCASGLDLGRRAVVLADGRPPIRYDVLSIDIGITPLVTALNSLVGSLCCSAAPLVWSSELWCWRMGGPPFATTFHRLTLGSPRWYAVTSRTGITPMVCRHLTHWYHPNGMLSPHALVSPQWYAVTSRTGITPMVTEWIPWLVVTVAALLCLWP